RALRQATGYSRRPFTAGALAPPFRTLPREPARIAPEAAPLRLRSGPPGWVRNGGAGAPASTTHDLYLAGGPERPPRHFGQRTPRLHVAAAVMPAPTPVRSLGALAQHFGRPPVRCPLTATARAGAPPRRRRARRARGRRSEG